MLSVSALGHSNILIDVWLPHTCILDADVSGACLQGYDGQLGHRPGEHGPGFIGGYRQLEDKVFHDLAPMIMALTLGQGDVTAEECENIIHAVEARLQLLLCHTVHHSHEFRCGRPDAPPTATSDRPHRGYICCKQTGA